MNHPYSSSNLHDPNRNLPSELQPDLEPGLRPDPHSNPYPSLASDPRSHLKPDPTGHSQPNLSQPNLWSGLRQYTPARIALGRVGASLPTSEVLNFSLAHARARDAVHLPLATDTLAAALEAASFPTQLVHTQAADRPAYLRYPHLGRLLHPVSRALVAGSADPAPANRLTIIVADGLSALAGTRHALPFLLALRTRLSAWSLDTVFLATQARVALSDEVGALRHAEAAVILLGERPGLSSPDSLGIYLIYHPRPGRTDADRNCISNVRLNGLSFAEAAFKLDYLLHQSRLAGNSGVSIKDNSTWQPAPKSLP